MAEPEHQTDRRSSMNAVFDRVNLVEREVAGVREQIAGLSTNMTNQAATLARISVNLEQKGATDWKALASWATVILAIVGGVATLVLTPLRGQIDANARSIERLLESRGMDQTLQIQLAEQRGRDRERLDQTVLMAKENRAMLEQLMRERGVRP